MRRHWKQSTRTIPFSNRSREVSGLRLRLHSGLRQRGNAFGVVACGTAGEPALPSETWGFRGLGLKRGGWWRWVEGLAGSFDDAQDRLFGCAPG
jgi:hypothetical protein